MNLTPGEAQTILMAHLRNSVLFTAPNKPNGMLYAENRPDNSALEDVVVNTLVMDNEPVQEGYLMVNAYTPNLVLNLNGQTDRNQPNIKRLNELSALLRDSLPKTWIRTGFASFKIKVSYGNQRDENKQWYTSYKVEFRALNISNS